MTGIGTLNLTVNSILHRAIKKTSLVRENTEKRIELYYEREKHRKENLIKGVDELLKKSGLLNLNP